MDAKYNSRWTGAQKDQICERIRATQRELNYGNIFRTVENTSYCMMIDSVRLFLQHHLCIPDPKKPSESQHVMVFGNPTMFGLLRTKGVDVSVDATFLVPHPFYQCLIFMVFDTGTSVYVPILYILMTHKSQELYWHAPSQVLVLSNWKINVNSYTSDFERAIMNTLRFHFSEGFHNACLFHWKQAIRRYLITKIGF